MDYETLRLKRGKACTALVREGRPGLSNLAEISRKLKSDAKEAERLRWRLQSYVISPNADKPRSLMPFETCIEVARLFGVQPSSLYIKLTEKEKKRCDTEGVDLGETTSNSDTRRSTRRFPAKRHATPTISLTITIPEFGIESRRIHDVKVIKQGQGFAVQLLVPVTAEQVLEHLI